MADLSNIQHIVVLMLENRSFDNVFGFIRDASDEFDGLMGNTTANNDGVAPWTKRDGVDSATLPDPDPGESFNDICEQVFNGGTAATMTGFRANYQKVGGSPDNIMHCFNRGELPALHLLADSFAVSDRWFASAPCQTWPNRFFAHTGTANGNENNNIQGFPFQMNTIFNELEGIASWNIYFQDFAQALLLYRLWPHLDHFKTFDKFVADAQAGRLPAYSFIEPMYYPCVDSLPNDMHPPHRVLWADALVAKTYNAVRSSPNWAHTLFIIVFDEHGGCYDHVPPPAATPPELPREGQAFAFDRFGVRVPAVLISPYTKAGSVVRPSGSQPFDHTSIIRTVRSCFGIKAPLSARDAVAPDLSGALNDAFDGNRGPATVTVTLPAPTDVAHALARPANGLQNLLEKIAQTFETHQNAPTIDALIQQIIQSKVSSPDAAATSTASAATAGAAGDYVRTVIQSFISRFKTAPAGQPLTATDNPYQKH